MINQVDGINPHPIIHHILVNDPNRTEVAKIAVGDLLKREGAKDNHYDFVILIRQFKNRTYVNKKKNKKKQKKTPSFHFKSIKK